MNDFKAPLQQVEANLTEQNGPFTFFALLLRDESPDRWDLVVAAPWMGDRLMTTIRTVSQEVSAVFPLELAVRLSRIAPVDPNDPGLREFARSYPVEHGWREIRNETFLGQRIVEGYIVTAQPLPQAQPQAA